VKSLKKHLDQIPPTWKQNNGIFGEACELWVEEHVSCIKCDSLLVKCDANQKSIDHVCSSCGEQYQVKCSNKPFVNRADRIRFLGAEYNTTLASMNGGNPLWNLLLVEYDKNEKCIENLLLIRKEDISAANIIARKPLSPTARRAGWQGCNFEFANSVIVEKSFE
tara:strand:+ start:715 stop:1209 length:495 start_codon:yes stop_codon:yes gene_type:complete